jgi:hypothetical protein
VSRLVRILLVAASVLALTAMPVSAGSTPKLHPSGFGEHSYAAWKAHEGLDDSTGQKDQALYFQKMTSTPTFAAGVAVFDGFSGTPASELGGLEFWWRTDGHCGAGAPRFNVRVDLGITSQTLFIGCAGMVPGDTRPGPNGTTYQQRTFDTALLPGEVLGLAIVFDEGNDVGPGFVYLDDIRVGEYVWTSASDNGGGNTPVDALTLQAMWGAPLETLLP